MQLELPLFGLFLVLAGYFSAAEAALLSISRMHLRHLVKTRKSEMQHVAKLKANPARMIMTILIGSNVSNISAAFLAASSIERTWLLALALWLLRFGLA